MLLIDLFQKLEAIYELLFFRTVQEVAHRPKNDHPYVSDSDAL